MKIFLISDTHFGHINIIKYSARPFKDVEDMDKSMIDNWNSVVGKDDYIIHCGDFSMAAYSKKSTARLNVKSYASQLNGHKIIVKGNHDNTKISYCGCGFDAQFNNFMKIGHLDFVHNLERANKDLIGPNDKIFYGHVHCFILDLPSNYRNVCVEHTDYKPIDITSEFTPDEIKQLEEIDKQYLSSNIPDIDKAR